jgi:extradiol dioxygenase family protein
MRLVSAKILPERTPVGELRVELTWKAVLVARKDWKALHAALEDRDIPTTVRTEVRPYASQAIAEAAVAILGGRLEAA